MKPASHLSRPKEWIPLSNYAFFDKRPDSIVLRDSLVAFEGARPDPAFLWGVYGTSSMNHMLFLADNYAQHRNKLSFSVQMWYHVDYFERVKSKISPEIAHESGFIHLDRLQSEFRDEIRDLVVASIKERVSGSQFEIIRTMNLSDIMMRHPECVRVIFDRYKKVHVVVHPVRQLFDETDRRPVHIATVRNVKSRIMAAEVRYFEEQIKVIR